jgi:hypothetical protein
MTSRFSVPALLLGLALTPLPGRCQALPPPLGSDEASEARRIVQEMKDSERGPYAAIRWYCADGSVQEAQGTPCRERGGGVQHGEMSAGSRRLASLQIHVGTVLRGVDPDSLVDAALANHWLKELVLGQYLFEVDDGWVLRRARYYRGARQIEDEEWAGEQLLFRLLSDTLWTRRNFLLASRLVATLPHPGTGNELRTQRIRNLATEVAETDPGFLRLRVKIHSVPSRDDLRAVEDYIGRTRPEGAARVMLDSLRMELARQYDPARGAEALGSFRVALGDEVREAIPLIQGALQDGSSREALGRMAELAPVLRRRVESSTDGRRNLVRMDLLALLRAQAFVLAQELEPQGRAPESRLARVRWLIRYLDLAYAGGFLSGREREALGQEALRLGAAGEWSAMEYREGVRYLARSLEWSWSRTRSVFGPAQQRYLSFEPRAQGFLDAEARGSILLPLSRDLTYLAADADSLLGASHEILGEGVSRGVRGLNPGLARGPLAFMDSGGEELDASRIYVFPTTPPVVRPVAGVLTLEEGNLLSHVQLLARSLGIPNASLAPEMEGRLRSAQGEEVLYAVSPLGRVILQRVDDLSEEEASLLDAPEAEEPERIRLDTGRLRLDRVDPLPLGELRAEASGVYVGPKAANLGQLAFYFPGQVAPGVALPFGMFVKHVSRPFRTDRPLLEELKAAYREGERMRRAGAAEDEVDAYIFRALEEMRQGILELEWQPEVREAIVRAVGETFGGDVGGGVFVRSDTNVEDLPQFSGAGLNLTLPNLRTVEDILQGVKQVWTSPFSERAYLWRKRVLEDQGDVYPSVLLLASVPSEKSGVLITTGLQGGAPQDLTIVTAEGVGGGVEGEEAETLLVSTRGEVRLLSQAEAPRRRALVNGGSGGVEWLAAANPDTLLTPGELAQLVEAANRWKTRFAPGDSRTAWDMEFGFVEGKLWLFQVRPFVPTRNAALLARLGSLDRDVLRSGSRIVSMVEPI